MNKKILMVPLDERPCNYRFPQIMPKAGFDVVMPPLSLMGLKKKPADVNALHDWIMDNAASCDIAILALDTVIYGGLIPSRLHHDGAELLSSRADIVMSLKKAYPGIKIFAFLSIMRCPFYSLSDEEPDYYADYGKEIHRYGRFTHKSRLGIISDEEKSELLLLTKTIPTADLSDYEVRRDTNVKVMYHVLDLVKDGCIDSFIVPQDDSAPYGYTSMDQAKVRAYIKKLGLEYKVPVYPAADDTGLTMLNRAVNAAYGVMPKVYVHYASTKGATVIPSFEDRIVDASVKNQIFAAGMQRVYSLTEADILLAVNIGGDMLYDAPEESYIIPYDIERNLSEYISYIKYALSLGKIVAVADVAYPSGADHELVKLLSAEGLLLKIHAYASWNTSSNTLGTVLCESGLYLNGRDESGNRYFLLHRYYDDVGYCSHTRTFIDETAVPESGCTVFKLDGVRGKCVKAAHDELLRYMRDNYPELSRFVRDVDVSSPWNRTFEMNFELETEDLCSR